MSEDQKKSRLRSIGINEFLKLDIPPREMLLDPIIATQSLTMIHSWRGIGKTNLALGMSLAIAAGGKFLRWSAPKARRVLYVDGEMQANEMQRRIKKLVRANGGIEPPEDHFRLVTPDLQEEPMPDLSTSDGQAALEKIIFQGYDFIVLDNYSTLCPTVDENDAQSWGPMQGWLLSLRRRRLTVMALHHEGKNGKQRGTSRREDALDTVIKLVRPDGYKPSDGARFELHFEKARSLWAAADMNPIEASIREDGEDVQWLHRDVINETRAAVVKLYRDALTQREIATELKIAASTVNRHLTAARESGLLVDEETEVEVN